jgi:GNAT superfamily N-acetyltransferase
MYDIRNLENSSIDEITVAWNLAFSDYIVPHTMTPESVDAYFKVAGVDRSLSFGAFFDGELVGLLLNSVDDFHNKKVAFDAMTGIAPEHRGKGLFTQLFEHTKNSLKGCGIESYYLEIITTNENAYSIYKKKGAEIVRELSFLTGKFSGDICRNVEVKMSPLSAFLKDNGNILSHNDEYSLYYPAFANRLSSLKRNIENYQVAFAEEGNNSALVIFNEEGTIPQIM